MKRLFIFSLLLLSSAAYAKNKISMVTYFPVPYVAYSQVNTTDQMDIGLTSTCDMKLGCSEESATLNATRVNLKGGKLNLDGGRGIKGYTLSLGSGNGDGKISFQNVRIQTGNMESVNAADIKAANLNLFGKSFPSCKSANSESNGQMQWASLKLKGASSSELYLACGEVTASAEQTCAENPNQEKCCTADQEWNGSRCVTKEKPCTWTKVSDNYIVAPVGDLGLDDNCDENIEKGGSSSACCSRLSTTATCMDVYAASSISYMDYYLTNGSSWEECPGSSHPDFGLAGVSDKKYNGYDKTQYVKDHWSYYAGRNNGSFDPNATYWGCVTSDSYSDQVSENVFKAVYKQAVYRCQ